MKKSLLALGAVAALGGLGFSGAANAVWVVGNVANSDAQTLASANDTGIGHILITPYFSTTNNTGTLLSVVNTDTHNGKAVKVRFRGAANSDDVFDFQVLLSPGDVWSASVSQGADGRSRLITPDASCVLPNIPNAANTNGLGQPFTTTRLDQNLPAPAQAAHTQEGYVEWLNMADIPEGTPLYKAIKHVKNVAPCDQAVMNYLMKSDVKMSEEQAATYGLLPPTGQLMGNWTIYNSQNVTSYGGPSSAIVAVDTSGEVPAPAAARLFFAPQIGAQGPNFPSGAGVFWSGLSNDQYAETADPLLTTTTNGAPAPATTTTGILPLLPFDLPDLSTPYVSAHTFAGSQSTALSYSLAAESVMNEWTAGADNGVDFSTDWVFSQPTRRYHAAIAYKGSNSAITSGTIVHNAVNTFYKTTEVEKQTHATYGDMLCLKSGQVSYTAYNREESTIIPQFGGGEWSPGVPAGVQPGFCGEVALMQFGENRTRALNGVLSVNTIKDADLPSGGAGWMSVGLPAGGLPVIGYSANTFNTAVGSNVGNYGDAITHRYKRPVTPVPPMQWPPVAQ